MAPTYVIAVGGFGASVTARLAADPEEPGLAMCDVPAAVPDGDRARFTGWLAQTAGDELERLLREGATQPGAGLDHDARGKLDLVIVADAEEAQPAMLGAVADTL